MILDGKDRSKSIDMPKCEVVYGAKCLSVILAQNSLTRSNRRGRHQKDTIGVVNLPALWIGWNYTGRRPNEL